MAAQVLFSSMLIKKKTCTFMPLEIKKSQTILEEINALQLEYE